MLPSESVPSRRERQSQAAAPDQSRRATAWALALFAVGYNLAHHNSLFGASGAPEGTRVADWIDLFTPFVVALPLLWFLSVQAPGRRQQALAAIGTILYAQGHGIHLSANSIGNAIDADAARSRVDAVQLWDEVVGHYVWYIGLAILLAVCVQSVRRRPLGLPEPALALGGAVSGLTWATNGLEGGTAVFSLACAVASIALVDRQQELRLEATPMTLIFGSLTGLACGFALVHRRTLAAVIVAAVWPG